LPRPLIGLDLMKLKKSCFLSKGIVLLLTLFLTASLLWGCSGGSDSPLVEDAVTFTDDLGRTVTVSENPRTAALLGSFADVWLLSGGTLCAASSDAWDELALSMGDAVSVGGAHSPNSELLLAQNPEFVLLSASTASHRELLPLLERVGIAAACFNVDTFDDYLRMLEVCTSVTGRRELYEKNGTEIARRIDALKEGFGQKMRSEAERTVLLLRASSGSVKAKGSRGTILGEMLADLGCINLADKEGSLLESLSVESVIAGDPYRIFLVTMGDDTEGALANFRRLLSENPAWGELTAVKEGRLHVMERRLFNRKPNAAWAEAYEKLVEILEK